MKKAIIVYDTKFGNTERIAKALASGMEEQGISANCLKTDEADINRLDEYDLLAVGGPTHAFGTSQPMKAFLKRLEGVDLGGKKAFAFDTKMKSRFAGSAAKRIEKALKHLRMDVVRSHASAIVKGSEGPLENGMEDTFRQIGAEIAKAIQ